MTEADERIGPTPERILQARGHYNPGNTGRASKSKKDQRQSVSDGCIIDALFSKRIITKKQYEAGDQLWADMYRAGMEPRITVQLDDRVDYGGGFLLPAEERIDVASRCQDEVRKAMDGVGRQHWRVLELAVRDNKTPVQIGMIAYGRTDERQARASGTDLLRSALDALGDHYGL